MFALVKSYLAYIVLTSITAVPAVTNLREGTIRCFRVPFFSFLLISSQMFRSTEYSLHDEEKFVLVPSKNKQEFHIPRQYENYHTDIIVWKGGFDTIIRKFVSPDGQSAIAIKKYLRLFESAERARLIIRELDILKSIRHPNVVRFLMCYSFDENSSIYHITEYCGDNLSKIIDQGQYSIEHVKKWTYELLDALKYLNAHNIIHKNLNPDSMCINPKNQQLTVLRFDCERVFRDSLGDPSLGAQDRSYSAIETFLHWNEPYDEKVVIWSIAAILSEMISGVPLFDRFSKYYRTEVVIIKFCGPADKTMLSKISDSAERLAISRLSKTATRKDFIKHMKEITMAGPFSHRKDRLISDLHIDDEAYLRDFLDRTLQLDPDTRMPLYDAMKHPFLKSHRDECHRQNRDVKENDNIFDLKQTMMSKLDQSTFHQKNASQHNQDRKDDYKSRFFQCYTPKTILGVGGFGVVFEVAYLEDDSKHFAVKRISTNDEQEALREVKAMEALMGNQGIVRMLETWTENPPEGWQEKERIVYRDAYLYIRMELCQFSLRYWIDKNTTVSSRHLSRIISWFKQIVSAVSFIHEKNFIHRDLKPCNILFSENGRLKVCDLGIATMRKIGDSTVATRTCIGTPLYMSPEQSVAFPLHSSKTDVFSLGLILVELCIVMAKFEREEIFNNYRKGKQCDRIVDEPTKEFVRWLTQVDPAKRPTCNEMLAHKFLL